MTFLEIVPVRNVGFHLLPFPLGYFAYSGLGQLVLCSELYAEG